MLSYKNVKNLKIMTIKIGKNILIIIRVGNIPTAMIILKVLTLQYS